MNTPTLHRFDIRVYSEDTDYMGVMYHANYVKFFERARSEFLREQGLCLTSCLQRGIQFAITKVLIEYHRPAKLDDYVTVWTSCEKKRLTMVEFTQIMTHESGERLSEAVVSVVALNRQHRPTRIPDEWPTSSLHVRGG